MIPYPKDAYLDIRTEEVDSTVIVFQKNQLESIRERKNYGKYLRLFDGSRWYTHSTTDPNEINDKISELLKWAQPNNTLNVHPRITSIPVINKKVYLFEESRLNQINIEEKRTLLESINPILEKEPLLMDWKLIYNDFYSIKHFESSIGSDISYDKQLAGYAILLQFKKGTRHFQEIFQKTSVTFSTLSNFLDDLLMLLEKAKHCLLDGKGIEPGKGTIILSPMAAGIFAHESFGHKSEADFISMAESSEMTTEWPLGKKVGSENLSIVDNGNIPGGGYVPFDDEGYPAQETYLIKNGVLTGRLHSIKTALEMGESPTGNARAVNYEFDPMVRMTTTFIQAGHMKKDEVFASVDHGYFIDTVKHGSGMSRFTLAPSIAYKIERGKIQHPVDIAVVSGHVMETLYQISGLSDQVELFSFAVGGCGKFEQMGLSVGLGGPFVRIERMDIQ